MPKRPDVLGIIPARGGSKSIFRKNMVNLAGKPLIKYTIDAAKKSRLISRLIVSSDDSGIISYCRAQGVEAPFVRPGRISGDKAPMIDVVKHAVDFLRKNESYRPDYIILLQPTSPLRKTRHIDEALKGLIYSDADSIVSVVEVPHQFSPYSAMMLKGGALKPFKPLNERKNLRQVKKRFYGRNGPAILALTYNCLKKNSLFGKKILPYLMNKEDSIDIDDRFDLKLATLFMKGKKL